MLTFKELDEELAKSPAPRVTEEQMKARIAHVEFKRMSLTMTHCRITLDNGYGVSGESACVSVDNYNKEIGEKIAYDNAFRQLWALFGFALAEDIYNGRNGLPSKNGEDMLRKKRYGDNYFKPFGLWRFFMTLKDDVLANGKKLDQILEKLSSGGSTDLTPVLDAVSGVKTDVGGVKADTTAILAEFAETPPI